VRALLCCHWTVRQAHAVEIILRAGHSRASTHNAPLIGKLPRHARSRRRRQRVPGIQAAGHSTTLSKHPT
jgi:hypothetical protein